MKGLNGRKMVMSRAPMTTPSVLKVRVIGDDHPWADIIEEDTAYISPLGVVLDAGDNDGDPRTFVDAEDSSHILFTTNVGTCIDSLTDRTGSDQLVPGGSYWGDHYNIPSAKAVAKKRGLSKKNLSVDTCSTDLNNPATRKSLVGMLEGSTLMFQEAVGQVHRLFLTTDVYLSTLWALEDELEQLFPDWKPVSFAQNRNLILILSEIYEVPLGGLSWEAYDVIFGTLIPLMKDGQNGSHFASDQIKSFAEGLNEAGMNGSAAEDVLMAAEWVYRCKQHSRKDNTAGMSEYDKNAFFASPEVFLQMVAEISAIISKGQFDFKDRDHLAMCAMVQDWITTHDPSLSLVGQSVVLSALWEFINTVLISATGGVAEIDLDYFD